MSNRKHRKKPLDDRIRIYVGDTSDPDACWIWTGPTAGSYGSISFNNKSFRAHRFMYEKTVGPIPCGMLVRHKCDNRLCVNPKHLTVGTYGDNYLDAWLKNRHTKGSKCTGSILNEEKVSELLRLKKSGMSISKLAKHFGVSLTSVKNVMNGKTWNWFTGIGRGSRFSPMRTSSKVAQQFRPYDQQNLHKLQALQDVDPLR